NRAWLTGRPARFVYLLRGLLRCSLCGRRYESVPSHSRRYYRCHGQDRFTAGPRCSAPWLSADAAEAAVWAAVTEALRRPRVLRQSAERYATARGARDVELRSRVEHVKGQLRTVEQKEQRLLELYVEDRVQAAQVSAKLRQLAGE